MGKLAVVVSEDFEKKFREKVFKRYGLKRGVIKKAMKEALKLWIKTSSKL